MSKTNATIKPTRQATSEGPRRRRTAAVVKRHRKQLESLRDELDQDFAKAFATLDALQAWADGGTFPETAIRYARLAALTFDWNGPRDAAEHQAASRAICKLYSGANYEELGETFDRAHSEPLDVACGRSDAGEVGVRGRAA